jgi:hypothetical protein
MGGTDGLMRRDARNWGPKNADQLMWGHLEYGQLSRSVPDVPLRLNDHPAAAGPTISMVHLQLAARESSVLVRYSRQQELKCIASRPYEALSAQSSGVTSRLL